MNTNEEIRCGYKISAQIKKVWAVQLKMTQYIINLCHKHNLKIWAASGTLLGAVRHKGYIPWDDDIDLVMFRDDYDKLISISQTEVTDPYFFQCAYTEDGYLRGHAQLRYTGTAAILPSDIYSNIDQSIFIDIFVYDAISDNKDYFWRKTIRQAKKTRVILNWLSYNRRISYHPLSIIKYVVHKLLCLIYHNPLKLFQKYENLLRQYRISDNKFMCYHAFIPDLVNKYNFMKEWYSETIMLPFEDIYIPAPINYHDVLKVEYGNDYMLPKQLPSMHGVMIFSTEYSYKDLLPDLRKQDKQESYAKFLKYFNFYR